MFGWWEAVPDLVLCSLFIFLLIRLATASDEYFKRPFYVFFISTGVYSVITVITYQIVAQFPYSEEYWTIWFYKPAYALNAACAFGATFGKATIAVHRYYVMRTRDFSEKKLSARTISRILFVQLVLSIALTASIWPASYVYKNQEEKDQLIALSRLHTLIQRGTSVVIYALYIICNTVFTLLTSRELYRIRRMLDDKTATSRSIVVQQRHMFIIVAVCSLSHLVKALQQFSIAVSTYFEQYEVYNFVWPLYPLVNGLAAYAAPVCLILLSPKVRERILGATRIHPDVAMTTVAAIPRKT